MLEVVFYMFLAGCTDDMTQCQEIASPLTTYASAEDCMSDLASVVQRTRSDWPTTSGVCNGSALDRVAARPDWLAMPVDSEPLTVATMFGKSAS